MKKKHSPAITKSVRIKPSETEYISLNEFKEHLGMKPDKQEKKKYTLKPTKKQMRDIKKHWQLFRESEASFFAEIETIAGSMAVATGIDDIEFIFGCDGWYCGVGNASRTMALIQDYKLERKK